MPFTTLYGGLCQTAFIVQFTVVLMKQVEFRCPQNRMGDARPQHRELHALLFMNSVWVF